MTFHSDLDLPTTYANAAPLGADDNLVMLRNAGGKPMRLQGELIAEASSWAHGAPAWHEVTLYQADGEGYAVGIKTCLDASGDIAVHHARSFADLDGALAWLQEYDPTADLGSDIDVSDRRISTTDIVLRAAALRQRADWVELQYRSMIGELLYRLDLGE
jgi:hypothetical protein